MIALTCGSCGKNLEISPERAGSRGKCPSCANPFQIPEHGDAPSKPEGSVKFQQPVLEQLIQKFVEMYPQKVIHSSVFEPDGDGEQRIHFTIATGTAGDRSQRVCVHFKRACLGTGEIEIEDYPFYDSDSVIIFSTIGEVTTLQDMTYALSFGDSIHHCSVTMDNEFVLRLSRIIPDIESMDKREFSTILLEMAYWADRLEEVLFGVDQH